MRIICRVIALWLVLGGMGWLLVTPSRDLIQPLSSVGLLLLPPLAVWLTMRAVRALPARWPGRIGFWAVTVPGWFVLLTLAHGRWEAHTVERTNLMLAFGLAGGTATWLAAKTRSLPTRRVVCEVAATFAVLAAAGTVIAWTYDAGTRSIAARGEARWTEIGWPMAELEKTLTPRHENAGSEAVRQVLRERVNTHFYKDGTRAAEREPAIEKSKTTKGFIDLLRKVDFAKLPPSDDIDLTSQPVAAFAPLAPALETDYRRILAVEPPVWATDPNDGFFMSVPNFLGIRQFAQLTAADAIRRFSVGDQEGAARALAAGLHLREGLRKNPNLVSLMIGIAVDGLLTAQQVRLPASENGLQSIADDTARQRAELIWQLRIEGWLCLKMADKIAEDAVTGQTTAELLPKWARKIVSEPWFRRECAIAVLNGAEHARIAISPQTLALPDLGAGLHDSVSKSVPTLMEANITRAAMRLHAVLLLREQAELIRDARARLAAGRPVESHDSVVLPGLRWELTADVEKGTVSTRLIGEPEWIAKHEVTPADFWILPLDGSVAWQFHRPAHTASGF